MAPPRCAAMAGGSAVGPGVPLEGGGRLVVELNADEAAALGKALDDVVG